MHRKPSNIDVITFTIRKILESTPEFETEQELIEWLKQQSLRPKEEQLAEGRKALEEAKAELAKITYLY